MMKTILIPVSNSFFVRNFLRTDALPELLNNPEVRLVLLAPPEKIEYYRGEFPHPRINFDLLPPLTVLRAERIFKILEYASIRSHTATMLHWFDLKRRGTAMGVLKRVPFFLVRRLAWRLGGLRAWRNFVRRAYALISGSVFSSIFEKYKPDLVFSPALLYGEYLLLKEAQQRRIPTAGMVLSWDNFYSKTFLRVHPDTLFVHTARIGEQAVRWGDYPRGRIRVVGIPQYDSHFLKRGIKPREEFFKEIGGDPSRPLILYAFSGKAGLDIDFQILDILSRARLEGEIHKNIQILVRPYPRYDLPSEKLTKIKGEYRFLAEPAMAHVGKGNDNWEFDERSLSLLENSIAHSDLVITLYSTFFIEAAIFNKPLIAAAFDGYEKRDYWNSARRFFDWDHLSELKPLDGITFAGSAEELLRSIRSLMSEPKLKEEGRKAIVNQQCQFTDGRSGRRLGQALCNLVQA